VDYTLEGSKVYKESLEGATTDADWGAMTASTVSNAHFEVLLGFGIASPTASSEGMNPN
jgi:hypothetical protein